MAGDLRAALEALREARACAARAGNSPRARTGFSASNWIVMMTGWVLFDSGRPEEGRCELEQALTLARDHGETELLGWAHELSAHVAAFRGDSGRALDHARQAFDIAERIGSSFSRSSAYEALGCVHLANRDWAASATAFEQALSIVLDRRIGIHWEARIVAELAEAQLGAGDVERARAGAEKAVRRAHELSERGIQYLDVGTSGGVWGIDRGYCLMIGGDPQAVGRLEPIFRSTASAFTADRAPTARIIPTPRFSVRR